MTEQGSRNPTILCLGAPPREEIPIENFNTSQLPGEIRHIEALTLSERESYDRRAKWLGNASKGFFIVGSFWSSNKLNSGELATIEGVSAVITATVGLVGLYLTEFAKYASSIAKRPDS